MEKKKMNIKTGRYFLKLFLILILSSFYSLAWSQTSTGNTPDSNIDYTLAYVLVAVVILFVFVIWFLTKILENVSDYYIESWKKDARNGSQKNKTSMILFPLFLLSSTYSNAQSAVVVDDGLTAGIPSLLFYVLVSMILIEFSIVMIITWQISRLLYKRHKEEEVVEYAEDGSIISAASKKLNWWEKLNEFKPMAKESEIDLGHDYDGIRELDNKLPPWWLYGFYLTIIVGVIYFYRYNIAHTGLSGPEEYELAVLEANKVNESFLKKAGNKVDENTVTLITDPVLLANGEANFKQLCAVCHGQKGEGLVGPNLTDAYWIYGGGIKDVFKTIKYGTNKGMQSWKENLSAEKIAQISSYVKSLQGTKAPNAKAPEGELYVENLEVSDSTSVDTLSQ